MWGDTNNKKKIVGAEECKSKSSEARQALIHQHIATLQRKEEYHGAKMVVCVEANLGAEAQHYCNYLRERQVHNLIIMKEDKDFDGWRTTNLSKKSGYLRCNEILNDRRLKFYERIHTIEGAVVEGMTIRERIIHQLRAFTVILEPSKKAWIAPKEVFTGKLSGEDDLAIVVQMALLIYERYKMRIDEYESRVPRRF